MPSTGLRPEPVLPKLLGSPLKLRSAVKTLIDNAIEAIAAPQAKSKRPQRREISLLTQATRETLSLIIDDSGPGIPQELRLKVFEPFFSANGQPGRHLGTGLARAQQIIADHSGMIDILDAPQGGCRIAIDFCVDRSG